MNTFFKYLLHLMSFSTMVANTAVLSPLSWFPQCLQWTLWGWAAGEREEGRGGPVQTQTYITDDQHLSPPAHHTAPSLNTQHMHTYQVTSSKDCHNLGRQFIHSVLCLTVAQDIPRPSRSHCYHAPTSIYSSRNLFLSSI